MTPSILYTACIASAIGLYLLARSSNGPARGIGTLIGLGGLAYLLVGVMGSSEGGMYASILPMIFGIIGVMAAVRATGSFESVSYLECIDMAPVVSEAQTISASYKPANS